MQEAPGNDLNGQASDMEDCISTSAAPFQQSSRTEECLSRYLLYEDEQTADLGPSKSNPKRLSSASQGFRGSGQTGSIEEDLNSRERDSDFGRECHSTEELILKKRARSSSKLQRASSLDSVDQGVSRRRLADRDTTRRMRRRRETDKQELLTKIASLEAKGEDLSSCIAVARDDTKALETRFADARVKYGRAQEERQQLNEQLKYLQQTLEFVHKLLTR